VTAGFRSRRYFPQAIAVRRRTYANAQPVVMKSIRCLRPLIFQKYRGHHAIAEQNQNRVKKLSDQAMSFRFSFLIFTSRTTRDGLFHSR